MSTLTQRFLTELDTEWHDKPLAERQSLREQLAARLDQLTQAERELGASEQEAQRRAVRTIGSECALDAAHAIRLSPLWQIVLIFTAVSQLLWQIPITLASIQHLSPTQPLYWVIVFVETVIAALAAVAWHPRAAVRGILLAKTLQFVLGTLSLATLLHFQPQLSAEHSISGAKVILHFGCLCATGAVAVATVFAFQKLRTKKLPKTL
jgi:hypothetical protein